MATALRVDNAGGLYAFCPEHTFTTYALSAEHLPPPKRTGLASLVRFLDSLAFRVALTLEGLRWSQMPDRVRIASRR